MRATRSLRDLLTAHDGHFCLELQDDITVNIYSDPARDGWGVLDIWAPAHNLEQSVAALTAPQASPPAYDSRTIYDKQTVFESWVSNSNQFLLSLEQSPYINYRFNFSIDDTTSSDLLRLSHTVTQFTHVGEDAEEQSRLLYAEVLSAFKQAEKRSR